MTPRHTGARPGSQKKSFWRETGEALFIALLLALVIRAFLAQAFSIPSGSMEPTLKIGDYLLVNKFAYGIRNPFTNKVLISTGKPQRGDVAVFIFPEDRSKDYIKRVIGLPGDHIKIVNKKVYINGKLYVTPEAVYDDPMIIPPPESPLEADRDNMNTVVVPPHSYFVMGDNRDHSYDSRFWGFVPMKNFLGKAFIIYFSWRGPPHEPIYDAFWGGLKGLIFHFSWNSKDFNIRWDRIGRIIR